MKLAALDHPRVDAYLARLGSPPIHHNPAGLAALQAAHLRSVPFHNLLLLVNDGRPYALKALDEVVDDAIAGVGGNCDRTTPPFAALLQSIGFDATLVAATVREPGDHFVCLVRSEGGRYLCDVGNGHPYLRPWDLDGPRQEQSFNGWRFVFDPHSTGGPTLWRDLGEGHMKAIYVVDPTPQAYDDFGPMVNAHYSRAGFGPFLSGLRSVKINADAVLTLRDAEYTRYTRVGRLVRRVHGREAIRALLGERFGLPCDLVDRALSVLSRRRPDLLAEEPRWMALGRGTIGASAGVEAPVRAEVPDILISAATVGRTASVKRLLDSIAHEVESSGYPGRVGVLLVDNLDNPAADLPTPPELSFHRVSIRECAPGLERAAATGVIPGCERLPAPIGVAREAQLHAIRAHLSEPIPGLPHPAAHPTVVWMLDDDVVFEQLGADGITRRRTHLLYRVARFWATLPQHSVVLGTFTGDPPVPGLDSLGGQLHDLAANAKRMLALGPEAHWAPPPRPQQFFDAYYDLSEAPPPPRDVVWPYAPDRDGHPVTQVALSMLVDLRSLLNGQQLTRPLLWDGMDAAPRPSLRRGGNTLFLDIDALFRWPTPVLASLDGVVTRRGDTLWAALAQRDDPGAVVEATLPLLHSRDCQADPQADFGAHSASQVRGVVMARAISHGRPVVGELAAREARVTAQREHLRRLIGELVEVVSGFAAWHDPEVDGALSSALEVLEMIDQCAARGAPRPGRVDELEIFLRALPAGIQAWRGMW